MSPPSSFVHVILCAGGWGVGTLGAFPAVEGVSTLGALRAVRGVGPSPLRLCSPGRAVVTPLAVSTRVPLCLVHAPPLYIPRTHASPCMRCLPSSALRTLLLPCRAVAGTRVWGPASASADACWGPGRGPAAACFCPRWSGRPLLLPNGARLRPHLWRRGPRGAPCHPHAFCHPPFSAIRGPCT